MLSKNIIRTKWGNAKINNNGYYMINGKLLHRLIFEDFYGQIPDGCHVHHKDGNTLNNCILNLQLLTEFEHKFLHNKGKKMSDVTKQKISKKMSEIQNTTGYYRVYKRKNKTYKQGFQWCYQYYDETGKRIPITSVNLDKLKEKVKAKGLPWYKIGGK